MSYAPESSWCHSATADDDILQGRPARAIRDDEAASARLTVVEYCPEDARTMLEMLGLA